MKSTTARCLYLFPVLLAFIGISLAQVATGVPRFNSFGGGPFDAVNLGSLNVHFGVPIMHKAGRGLPFSYDLSYDSSVWYPVGVSGNQAWQPVTSFGWSSNWGGTSGYLSYSFTQTFCYDNMGHQTGSVNYYQNWGYHDPWTNAVHGFTGSIVIYAGSCSGTNITSFTSTATDSSGLTLNVNNLAGTITLQSGTVLNPPNSAPTGPVATTSTDANGNQITSNTSGVFTDTLGQTALTISGTSPVTFAYAAPSGSKNYTMNYSAYNIKTNFGCSGVAEYSASNVSLVSSISLPDGSQYSFAYEDTPSHSGYKTGRISQVTLPTGGTISYNYTYTGSHDGINCGDGSTVDLERTLSPGGTWQYSRSGADPAWTTTVIDPSSNYTTVNFEKDTATPATNNLYETQRLMYQGNTSGTLLSTNIMCYNGQSVSTPSSCYNTGIASPITRVTNFRYLPNAAGLQSETDSYYSLGLINEVDEYDFGSAVVGSLIRKTITAYATLGNGIVDRPSSVTIKDSGSVVRAYTAYGYDQTAVATPSGTTPQWVSVSGARGNLTSVSAQASSTINLYRKYTYYNTGMLNTSTDVSTSSTTNGASTTYNYNNTGTPSPSCGNSFVTSISEPVGSMSRSFTWDCNGGVLLQVTDENSNISSTAYSGSNYTNVFWRPYSTTDEAGTTTDYFYYLNTNTPPQPFQTESKYHAAFNGGNSTIDKVTTNDGFGRAIFSQTKQGPSASNYDTVATCYDSFGRTSLSTLPYSAALATSTSTCPSTNAGTAYDYDALGRTNTLSDNYTGGGSTSYSYSKNDTLETRTSPTVSKQSEADALGRLKSVCEITSGTTSWPSASCNQNTTATGYLTSYAYDVLSNLTTVTQNNQASSGHQGRSYAYDMLSRLTSETNPETNNAAVTYAYDSLTSDTACGTITSAGNLLKRLDAASNASCSSGYDALHRVGAVTYPSSSTPAKHFIYDAATVNSTAMGNAKTRLAEAYTCTGTCSSKITDLGFSYAATGRQTDVLELTPHSGTNYYFHVTETPWPNGAINTISNLVGLPTITYGADGEGRVSSVSAASGQHPVTSVSYNAASQATALTYGSSDSDSFTIDPNTGRMSQYQFTMGSSPKTDTGVLTWNTNGSLQKLVITDQINSANTQTCNYTHDDLGRTASANCGTTIFNQNFTYDPFGNITKTVPGGSTGTGFAPSYDYTNYTNRMTSTPFTYNNNNGALTADSSHGYGWDTSNRLTTVDSGTASGVCVTYDAMDRVVEQAIGSACATSPTSTAEIVYSPSGSKLALMNGSTLTKAFVGLPGGAQAVYNSSGLLFYRHADWLGSSRLATTPSRTCYWDVAYAPFGENYAAPSSGCNAQDLMFTGQNQDTESSASGGPGGLYDFMFRRQSPVQGRWLSPDPLGLGAASPSDPQTWNRYAYVGNRATNTVDPNGLLICNPDFLGTDGAGYPACYVGDFTFLLPLLDDLEQANLGGFGRGVSPQRTGGVWPDNETLGLPQGLNTGPLGMGGLLGLLPGCGSGSNPGIGFIAVPQDTSNQNPCVTLIPVAAIALAAAEGGGSGSGSTILDNFPVICDCTNVSGKIFLLGCTYNKCTCFGTLPIHHPFDPAPIDIYCEAGRDSAKACAAVPSIIFAESESDYEGGGTSRTILFPPGFCRQ